jgi:hypothetical protein
MSQHGQPERGVVDVDALIARLEMEYTLTREFTSATRPPAGNCTKAVGAGRRGRIGRVTAVR